MKKLLVATLCAVWVSYGITPAAAAAPTQRELLQVATDLGYLYDTSYASRNPAAMALVYAYDGVLISPAGPIVRGRDALRGYHTRRFAAGARDHWIKVLEVHVLGDGNYGINAFSVTVLQANGALCKEHGTIVAVYRHDPDGWHMSVVAPSASEPCSR